MVSETVFDGALLKSGGNKRELEQSWALHMNACVRSNTKSARRQPWELLPFLSPGAALPQREPPRGMIPAVLNEEHAERELDKDGLTTALQTAGYKVTTRHDIPWIQKLSEERNAAVVKWIRIIEHNPGIFGVARMFAASERLGGGGDFAETLLNVFALKASSTLHSRAGPILRFLKFCKAKDLQAMPFLEHHVYAFLEQHGKDAAPTFGRSFVCSLAFCKYVLDCDSAGSCISPRITGITSKFFMEKRKLKQKPPLLTKHVLMLEEIVLGQHGASLQDRHAAGFFCWCIYARARFSDGQASGLIQLDVHTTECATTGYIEASVSRSKSSYGLERKTRYLPVVAPIQGLADEPWAVAWYEMMKQSSFPLGTDKPLLPAMGLCKKWLQTPLSAEAGAMWLRALLTGCGAGADEVNKYGTHSCKATTLSWAAKAGMDRVTRATLGYHSKGRDGTELVYGRDNVAGPLRLLEELIGKIACKSFLPDASRSGYFAKAVTEEHAHEGEHAEDEQDVSSSEDSVDEERPDHEHEEAAVGEVVGELELPLEGYYDFSSEMLFRHSVSRVIHRVEDEAGDRFACGRFGSDAYIQLPNMPECLYPLCRQCFKRRMPES